MRRALVTGAAGGLGRAFAEALAARGCALVLTDRDPDGLKEMQRAHPGAEVVVADLASPEGRGMLCERLEAEGQPIDVLVNNAGYDHPGLATDLTDAVLTTYAAVNLTAPMVLSAAAVRAMTRQGGGHVFSVASLGGIFPMKGSAAYSGTKFGLRGFTAALALEAEGTGVHVGAIYPSAIDTPMLQREMRHPDSSPLNFVGDAEPLSPQAVVAASLDAMDARRLETWLPSGEGRMGHLVMAIPSLLFRVNRWLEQQGNRKKVTYLRSIGVDPGSTRGA